MNMGYLFVVTGRKGSGKTSSCLYVLNQAITASIRVGGVLEVRSTHPVTRGYDLLDCGTGRRIRLASLHRPSAAWFRPPGHGYWFSREALDVANSILLALERSRPPLAIVDEVGTLEMEGGGLYKGLCSVLKLTDTAPTVTIVSCRAGAVEWLYGNLARGLSKEIWSPGMPSELWARVRFRLVELRE